MSFDPIHLDLRSKNRSQSPAEFASAVEITRRRLSTRTKLTFVLAAVIFGTTVFMLGR